MEFEQFEINGTNAKLCIRKRKAVPLIVFIGEEEDDITIVNDLPAASDYNLLCLYGMDWEKDLTPWKSASVFQKSREYKGKANDFIQLIIEKAVPKSAELIGYPQSEIWMVGYSLAGLFALYSAYRCNCFKKIACVSGSLWYEGFVEFIRNNSISTEVEQIYISLGDAEHKSKNPILASIDDCTNEVVNHLTLEGFKVFFEYNEGTHFTDPLGRIVKGIKLLLHRH